MSRIRQHYAARDGTATVGRRLVLVLASVATLACSEPLEFADWTIPVPEGTRIVEYPGVPEEERVARIELVEDLVVRLRPGARP